MKVGSRAPDSVDREVGARIRMRRTLLKMSRVEFARVMGLSFQQVRNYEAGINKIGAGRLWEFACALSVPVSYFFDELNADGPQSDKALSGNEPLTHMPRLDSNEAVKVLKGFESLTDPLVRKRLIELVRTIAADEAERHGG